jgi:hypothetical protein
MSIKKIVMHTSQFTSSKILTEETFDIPLDGCIRKIIATAVYTENTADTGAYCLKFTIESQLAAMMQPDKMLYSREQAQEAAELAFSSGEVSTGGKED